MSVCAGLLGSLPLTVSLVLSPLTVSYCRRKSIRLTAVLGGLISSLACLFASFALQYHQLLLSYGIILGGTYCDSYRLEETNSILNVLKSLPVTDFPYLVSIKGLKSH